MKTIFSDKLDDTNSPLHILKIDVISLHIVRLFHLLFAIYSFELIFVYNSKTKTDHPIYVKNCSE